MSHEKETVGYHKVIERVSEFVSPLFTREEYTGSNRKNVYEWQCNTCSDVVHSHIDYGTIPRCKRCDPKTISKAEIEIANFIRSHGIDIKTNTNEVLGNLEYDIYIPSKNLAIEYNGTYWHSTKHKKANYHVDKYLRSKELGVHLIQIFEDEWGRSKEVILSRIKNILGLDEKVMARKCVVKEIDSKMYKNFLDLYHLQGATGSKHRYGLFFNEELMAVMGFSNSRYTSEGVELIRYCSKATVIGGAGKLLKYFINAEKPTKIVSYANRCWSNGNLYRTLGFTDVTEKENNVGYWYVKKGIRYHRSSYTKGKLIKMGFDVDKTESEIMDEMGYLKIYDCGNYKFVMDLANHNFSNMSK